MLSKACIYYLFVSTIILYKHKTKHCVCGVKHKFHKVLARYLSILYERQAIIKRQKTTVSPWDTVVFDTLFYPSDIVVFLFLPVVYGLIPRRRNSSQAEIVYAKCGFYAWIPLTFFALAASRTGLYSSTHRRSENLSRRKRIRWNYSWAIAEFCSADINFNRRRISSSLNQAL